MNVHGLITATVSQTRVHAVTALAKPHLMLVAPTEHIGAEKVGQHVHFNVGTPHSVASHSRA